MARLLLIGALLAPVAAAADVAAALKSTCEGVAKKYDVSCSVALYGRSGGTTLDATASAGFIDGGLGLGTKTVPASDDDVYVYGSITKMFTASAIYQLAERGALGLDDSLAYHVDAMLPGTATLATAVLVNDTARAGTITLRHALHMKSGISDYDGEKYAYEQFANRSRDFSPLDILLGGFVNGSLEFTPGEYQDYSSTNYILLGLVAARYDAPDVKDPYAAWKAFDQAAAAKGTLSNARPRGVEHRGRRRPLEQLRRGRHAPELLAVAPAEGRAHGVLAPLRAAARPRRPVPLRRELHARRDARGQLRGEARAALVAEEQLLPGLRAARADERDVAVHLPAALQRCSSRVNAGFSGSSCLSC